uniref:zinc finger CCCH domain-containing protein 39-like n=1 Tax=Erigeron canadensis TaxID=72917 RepID=UPI001CB95094|nr:zinc finger CCCH domain-containing protein 39-like [Erigeron canadensis]
MEHPFNGGNNGGSELYPKQNAFNSNKRSRNQEVSINYQKSAPLTTGSQRSNLPVNKVGNGNIFFKTRMCQRFLDGICGNGDGCSFAHGRSDLREPPPNWHELVKDSKGGNGLHYNDEDRWIQQRGICKKFYYRNECPYGDKCNFSHERPAKFRVDAAMDTEITRETSVISIQTMVDRGQSQIDAGKRVVNVVNTVQDASRASQMTNIWKPGACGKWETTSQCIHADKCHFAHGHAGISTGRVDVNRYPCPGSSVATNTVHSSFTIPVATDVPVQQHIGRGFLKLANRKTNRIYGDWIDDEEDESI